MNNEFNADWIGSPQETVNTYAVDNYKISCTFKSDNLGLVANARNKDNYKKKLRALSRIELLIIDEFLLTPTTTAQQSDILELLELRYNTHSTIFASQFLPQGWH